MPPLASCMRETPSREFERTAPTDIAGVPRFKLQRALNRQFIPAST